MDKWINPVARLLMAQIFIISGFTKLTGYAATEGYFAALGIPLAGIVTPLVILIELGGGILLLLGFKTRWVAAVLAVFTVATALIAHTHFADQAQTINFMKNLAMAGGLLMFVKYGASRPSIDDGLAR